MGESYKEYLDRRIFELDQELIISSFMVFWTVGIIFIYFAICEISALLYLPSTLMYFLGIRLYVIKKYKRLP